MKKITTLLILLALFCGCGTAPANETQAQLREKLRKVSVTHGISLSDATVIGECYFAGNVGCGAFTGIKDGGENWIVEGKFGYAASPVKGLFINKRTGRVTSSIGPNYDNPLDILP